MPATGYTLSSTIRVPFAEAVERVRVELKENGFGVLCEIDVAATMKEKLGVLLPCNVVVYERAGETHIAAIDAERMLSIVDNDELAPIATDVKRRPAAVVERASSG